jgi:hypothetical protein
MVAPHVLCCTPCSTVVLGTAAHTVHVLLLMWWWRQVVIIIIKLPNEAIASTPSAPRPGGGGALLLMWWWRQVVCWTYPPQGVPLVALHDVIAYYGCLTS